MINNAVVKEGRKCPKCGETIKPTGGDGAATAGIARALVTPR